MFHGETPSDPRFANTTDCSPSSDWSQVDLHPRCLCLLFPVSAALFTKQVRIGNIDKDCTSAAADLSTLARNGCTTMRPLAMLVKNFILAQRRDTGRKFTIKIEYHVSWAAAQLSNATECPSIANRSTINAQHAIGHLSFTAGDNMSMALAMPSLWR